MVVQHMGVGGVVVIKGGGGVPRAVREYPVP